MIFIKKDSYYRFLPVYEFNLPAGHSCPYAGACKCSVGRDSGRMKMSKTGFRCYASACERFPAVRETRWKNFLDLMESKPIEIPKHFSRVRIHASGDFYSQAYFDKWLEVCRSNPEVLFWAFTKSLPFWIARLDSLPRNLVLQASYGGTHDSLIKQYGLKYAKVFKNRQLALCSGLPIDTDDYYAMQGKLSFALVDNFSRKKPLLKCLKMQEKELIQT